MAGTAVRDGTANLALTQATCSASDRNAPVGTSSWTGTPYKVFAQPKPKWVRDEIIRLKALMPEAGCRTIAHHFNRRWQSRRQMTVSKTYVADTCRRHQYLIYEARRKMKHRVPRPDPRNRIWGCDLLTKTDQHGTPHLALAIVDHGSRAAVRLRSLSDKSSLQLVHELVQAVKRYGRPTFLRTDNEAVFTSMWFTWGLRLLGIRHQRSEPGCPWQNGRVERFIGTVKRALAVEPIADGNERVGNGVKSCNLTSPRSEETTNPLDGRFYRFRRRNQSVHQVENLNE